MTLCVIAIIIYTSTIDCHTDVHYKACCSGSWETSEYMMANHLRRKCKFCNAPIRMAEMDNGKWLPFEVRPGGGRHQCLAAIPETQTIKTARHASSASVELTSSGHSRVTSDAARHASVPIKGAEIGCLIAISFVIIAIAFAVINL